MTTDGFITDIENLEDKILNLPVEDSTLLRLYRSLRIELTTLKDPETGIDDPNTASP